jgi:translation initiation factor 3 subunit F
MSKINLPLGSTGVKVVVQPVVLFSVCDAFIRRGDGQSRVIGTLLGTIEAGVIDLRLSYAVPHIETPESVSIDIPHHRTLFDLHQKVNSKEVVVGWYSTGLGLSGSDALIQDFYSGECTNPIHLILDTQLTDGKMAIKAFVSRTLTLRKHQEPPLATEFLEVPCEVKTAEIEKIGVDVLSSQKSDRMPLDSDSLAQSIARLESSISQAHQYVDDVVEGRRKGDRNIGRYLADTVDAVPQLGQEELEKLCRDNTQDVLLVMYLANLVRTHVALADKLGTQALPLV